jgi:predicted lipoprotein with Yx(FWY)xxD motif
MLFRKYPLQLASILFVALLVAACGTSTTTGSGSSGTTPTTAPTSVPAVVKTAQVMVKGASQAILTNGEGLTLYYFTSDTATKAACTGTCVGIWPPLTFSGSGSPTSASTLPGTLTVVTDANGTQVEYNGHPLYQYSKDTAPGQTNGEGLFGKWFVATTNLQQQSAPQSSPTPYGY